MTKVRQFRIINKRKGTLDLTKDNLHEVTSESEGTYIRDYVSDVNLDGKILVFTGVNSAFNSGVDLSGLIPNIINPTGLEAINEGNGIGWRLIGRDPANYANIGLGAVDFSTITGTLAGDDFGVQALNGFSAGEDNRVYKGLYGVHTAIGGANTVGGYYGNIALGTYNNISEGYSAVAMGYGNDVDLIDRVGQGLASGTKNTLRTYWTTALGAGLISKSIGTVAIGISNTDYTETTGDLKPLFIIGNGEASISTDPLVYGTRISASDAFIVRNNGLIQAPSITNSKIDSGGTGKELVTVEWFNANNTSETSSGLEAINEGNGIGWRLIGRDPANFNINGYNSVDLSFSTSANSGASGNYSSVLGGLNNATFGAYNVTVGGENNVTSGGFTLQSYNVVVGGKGNKSSEGFSYVGGGQDNENQGAYGVINGGKNNSIETGSTFSSIGGGNNNTIQEYGGTIAGGLNHITEKNYGTVSGGLSNKALGWGSTVSGGMGNTAFSQGEWVGGMYGTEYTPLESTSNPFPLSDRIFNIGNGYNTQNRSDALTILKSGTVTFPSLTAAMIDAETTGKVPVTREYADANYVDFDTIQTITAPKIFQSDTTSVPLSVNNTKDTYGIRVVSSDPTGGTGLFSYGTTNFTGAVIAGGRSTIQTFTVNKEGDVVGNSFTGDGSGLTGLNYASSVKISQGSVIDLSGVTQNNFVSATSSASFSIVNDVPGGYAEVLINRATEPTVTGSTKIPNTATFIASTDMVLCVKSFGGIIKHWFIEF